MTTAFFYYQVNYLFLSQVSFVFTFPEASVPVTASLQGVKK